MKKLFIFVGLTAAFLVGCKGYVPRGFLPPPSLSEEWVKPGASKRDIIIALLECGFAAPDMRRDYPMTREEVAWASFCMESEGFTFNTDRKNFSWRWVCSVYSNEEHKYIDLNIDACQPNAIPPKRDINRRLNSQFCKDHPEIVTCK
jgi:hypothetical protein